MASAGFSKRSRRDLRGFIQLLEQRGQLRRITAAVDPDLELAPIGCSASAGRRCCLKT